MKRVLITVALLGGVAHAEKTAPPLVEAPAGWRVDQEQATALAQKANGVSHFGGATSVATADVYAKPEGGAALIVTAVAGKVVAADRNVAARIAVDELHDATARAALAGSGIVVDSWATQTVADQKAVRGDLVWRDTNAGTSTTARILVVADSENVVAVTGECVSTGAADPACVKALDTLDPGIALAQRQDIALAAPGTSMTAPTAPPPAASTMTEPTGHTPLPPMAIPSEKPATDRRPVYVGLGIVVLAAAFWWNQRRRARLEKKTDD